ncbi:MAG: oxalurate catabolism protein HpxZ [Alphaproteobacteria bacterium]
MEINIPEVLAEVTAAHDRYEAALTTNDVDVLNELFWTHDLTLRYGIGENLYGHDQIAGFRAARDPADVARTTGPVIVTTYGRDFGTANLEFHRESMGDKVGRQSQSWARMPEGWRIVAAHVSVIDK